ncbi:MAG: hypothetical protein GY708_17710, partial [Actinomycetia bacterium]|nr:hypothetical protein [Actinomycetes bacterium]
SVSGTVWFDSDVDGVIGGSEYALEGVELSVTWQGIDGVPSSDDVGYTVTTDPAGWFLVERLPAGVYTVVVTPSSLPVGMRATYDADGAATAGTITLSLGSGEDLLDQDFGYAGNGAFGDRVWLDSDGDGAEDVGEPGLVGVPIQLTWPGEDGFLGGADDELFLTTTASDGQYLISNMPPGEYEIEVLGGLPGAAVNTYDEDGGGDSTATVNLADLEYHLSADFGFHGTASIGDMVWWDMNSDGSFDAGEPGISSVAVELVFEGLDGVIGNSDDLTFATVTDSAGAFLFTDLPAGDYEIWISGNLPAGVVQTFDEDGGGDGYSLVPGLTVDELHLTADFGFAGTSAVGDLVWLDIDSDGAPGIAEPGIPAVSIDLTWHGGDGVASTSDDVTLATTTDVNGFYSFNDLPGGGYDVVVDPTSLPPGVSQTYDSDGLLTGNRATLSLLGGASDDAQDFGYDGGSSIGDRVWFDRSGDGVFGGDEYGIAGVSIDVIWAGPDDVHATVDDETFNVVTDVSGTYGISNLPPGQYAVVVDGASLPSGMAQTYDEDGVLDNQTIFTLADGEHHDTADFGYRGSGEIGDLVWFDWNGDGFLDAGEPGLPLQTVSLSAAGTDGLLQTADDETYTTVTDANGLYVFSSLPPGDYLVEVTGSITAHASNTSDEDGDANSQTVVTLGDGVVHISADYGYRGSAQIGDLVWLDLDADGIADADDPGVPGVEVTVTWFGGDGASGGGDDVVGAVTMTDAAGSYVADGLPSGDHGVAITSGIPAGLDPISDNDGVADGHTVVSGLGAVGADLDVDFGYSGSGTTGGVVWWDLNDDQLLESSEPGMEGVNVAATWAGFDGLFGTADDASLAAVTDNAGEYRFVYLPPGLFEIVVATDGMPAGVVQSADPDAVLDASSAVSIDPFGEVLGQDFGFRGDSSASGHVWHDVDSNGVHEATEPGVTDVLLSLTYLGSDGTVGGGDDISFTAATGAGGEFNAIGLPAGTFEIHADPATLAEGLTFAGDSDGGDPESTSIVLDSVTPGTDIDFLVVGDSTLGGTVWNDRNGNELIDDDEVGVGGISVTVSWSHPAGDVSIPLVTDAFGQYSIAGLPPGLYEAEIDMTTAPLGMEPTTGTNWPVVVGVSETENADFGIALMLDIGSTVWIDDNGDGVVDEGEAGIPNVTVNLYNEIGLLVAITETDADGLYLFEGLYPGVYTVGIASESVPSHLRASTDRDGDVDLITVIDVTGGNHALDANFGFQAVDQLPVTGFRMQEILALGLLFLLLGAVLVLSAPLLRRRGPGLVSPPFGGKVPPGVARG